MRIATHLDRYPAKMVSRLADRLVDRYAGCCKRLLDPFCGSGAVLLAAQKRGIPVTGLDVNPVAELFSRVKVRGFDKARTLQIARELIEAAKTARPLPISWPSKHYWFTASTLNKFERLRTAAIDMDLTASPEGTAVLLGLSLAVRLCSKADQRSPKPFISRHAFKTRRGRHFDPYLTITDLLEELSSLYDRVSSLPGSRFIRADITSERGISRKIGMHSHVITSPPYINAQDYFRNFKLELWVLEQVLPFSVADIRDRFIGTERGDLLSRIPIACLESNLKAVPELRDLGNRCPRLAGVVHRYLCDMGKALDNLRMCVEPGGSVIVVCGDNLVGGVRIRTWQLLRAMLEARGLCLFDSFSDPIENRMLPPNRCGHKGLIKEEVVCAFRA